MQQKIDPSLGFGVSESLSAQLKDLLSDMDFRLEYPDVIRVNDSSNITLRFSSSKQLAPIQGEGKISGAQVSLFSKYDVFVEARLELFGMNYSPVNLITEPFLPRQSNIFYWNLRPSATGNYDGNIWFYLHLLPKDNGEPIKVPLFVKSIKITSSTIWGSMLLIQKVFIIGVPLLFLVYFLLARLLKKNVTIHK